MVRRRLIACLGWTVVVCTLSVGVADASGGGFTPPKGLPDGWFASIDTSEGRIIARLLPDQAPQAVAHFTALAEGRLEWFDETTGKLNNYRYYDGVKIHRVSAGQLFEAGNPPVFGQVAPDLHLRNEGAQPVSFSRPGRLGMVTGGAGTSGVKFFVTASGQPRLNRMSPCFGEVLFGLDVVVRITQRKAYGNGRPIDPPVIERVSIFSVGQVAPLPQPEPYTAKRSRPGPKIEKKAPDEP